MDSQGRALVRRRMVIDSLKQHDEATIETRADRHLEVEHQGVVPNHYFAAASSECLDLYRDGFFLSAVMVSQAVNEGLWKFVLERNNIPRDGALPDKVRSLAASRIVSDDCAEAFGRIWGSFRNDVHHMNPQVAQIPIRELAKRNLTDLASIEREIFAVFTDLSTAVDRSESAPSLEPIESGERSPTSVSAAAWFRPACPARGAARL
jgi:hypothetical protein